MFPLWPVTHQCLHRRIHVEGSVIKKLRDKLILIIRLLLRNKADIFHLLKFHGIPVKAWLLDVEPGCLPILLIETLCRYVPDKKGTCLHLKHLLLWWFKSGGKVSCEKLCA